MHEMRLLRHIFGMDYKINLNQKEYYTEQLLLFNIKNKKNKK